MVIAVDIKFFDPVYIHIRRGVILQLNYADELLRDEKKSAVFGLREAVFNAPQLVPAGHDIGVMRKI